MNETALLVIDFINDIVNPSGKISSSASFIEKNQVIENANKMIQFARDRKMLICFVKVGFSDNYVECPASSPIFSKAKELNALQLNSWGTDFDERLYVQSNDLIIIKHRVSAFYGTSLELVLRSNGIRDLILTGVSTDMAIQTTSRDAHDRDFTVTIVSDACGAGSIDLHNSSLKLLERIANVKVSDDVINQR